MAEPEALRNMQLTTSDNYKLSLRDTPLPGRRAGIRSDVWRVNHSTQCGHQEPLCCRAAAPQSSNPPLGVAPVQN